MADYENRLRRLEDLAAPTDQRPRVSLEEIRKRTAELLNSPEVLDYSGPDISDEEWAVRWEAMQAAAKSKLVQALKHNNN
jgi:hypothetical protein